MMICKTESCVGCASCAVVCTKNAIKMQKDSRGFLVPYVNKEKCCDCGECMLHCPINKEQMVVPDKLNKVYSLVLKDEKQLKKSSSGGAFSALSDVILSKKGVVCGAVLNSSMKVQHVVVKNQKSRDLLCGSKYIQSDVERVYTEIRKLLETHTPVLFVGCPCQISGLNAFLGKKYAELYTMDFICHGVPNEAFFQEHINFMRKYLKKDIISCTWRSKKYGWFPNYIEGLQLRNQKYVYTLQGQSYLEFFWKGYSVRESCFECRFGFENHESDITIADFWEGLKTKKNKNGSSLVVVNSEKGDELFSSLEKCNIEEIAFHIVEKRLFKKQHRKPEKYEKFWSCYEKKGYEGLIKEFYPISITMKVKFAIKKIYRYWYHVLKK